jgi:co-chaperonin GroES (HSP10)
MRPLHNKVIVEQVQNSEVSAGGIIIGTKWQTDFCRVVAIGPDVEDVSVDDVILIDWSKAAKAGDQYVISEDNIVFVYEDFDIEA